MGTQFLNKVTASGGAKKFRQDRIDKNNPQKSATDANKSSLTPQTADLTDDEYFRTTGRKKTSSSLISTASTLGG